MDTAKQQQMEAIVANYVGRLTQTSRGEDHENRELARQVSQDAASYQREGWTRADYQDIRSAVYDAVLAALDVSQ